MGTSRTAVVDAKEGQMSWRMGRHTCHSFRKVVSGELLGTCPWFTLKVIQGAAMVVDCLAFSGE